MTTTMNEAQAQFAPDKASRAELRQIRVKCLELAVSVHLRHKGKGDSTDVIELAGRMLKFVFTGNAQYARHDGAEAMRDNQ